MCDTPEFGEEQKQAHELCERLRGAGGIEIKDRRYLLFLRSISFVFFLLLLLNAFFLPLLDMSLRTDLGDIHYALLVWFK